jgi:PAS domain S-box-containing protein
VTETHEFFRRLVEQSPDGVLVSDRSHVRFVNRAAAGLFGSVTDELLGRPLVELFHQDSHAILCRHVDHWLSGTGDAAPFDSRIVRVDGTTTDVEVVGGRVGESDSHTIQLVLREMTDRQRAESALRESEERLRLAFAGAREGVWDWNLETNAVVYSSRWTEMLGYAAEEIEPHVSAWERLVHPDDRSRADRANESVARGQPTYEAEFRLRHKHGHYVHVLSRGFPIRREPGGPVVRIVGTHFDLTERKRTELALSESEERLTLAFAGAQEGVWDWNLETNDVVYSPRWKEMLGYADDEIEPHVRAWERLLHPDDRAHAEELNEQVKRGARTYEGEFRLRHKDGHYVQVLSRGFPVRREPGGPAVRIVGTHFDLTERKRAEAERSRRELLARLVFAQEDERRRIARDMHDQFGEQLTALGHRIGALKESAAGNADICRKVEDLEAVAHRIDRDVDHLVWELRPTALDDLGLRAALANYVDDWSTRVGIPVELHTSGLLDERLAPDVETTLYRIAQEALNNVAKHSRAKNVDIILERRPDHVMLIVEDNGVGFNVSDDRTNVNGQGFGLLGMQERASLVGGTLEIESAAGKGTTILVRMTTTTDSPAHA